MSGAVRYVGLAILVLCLTVLLREAGFRGARLVSLVGCVLLVGLSVSGVSDIFSLLGIRAELSGDGGLIYETAVKILGVSIAFGITADFCRDMGESGVAGATLMLGRVEIFALITPHIRELLTLVRGYLGV